STPSERTASTSHPSRAGFASSDGRVTPRSSATAVQRELPLRTRGRRRPGAGCKRSGRWGKRLAAEASPRQGWHLPARVTLLAQGALPQPLRRPVAGPTFPAVCAGRGPEAVDARGHCDVVGAGCTRIVGDTAENRCTARIAPERFTFSAACSI